ncbi:hypothetical protein GPECTOR_79g130 [Gonium pectorale]|uniref:EamA domain-containing protein n=1 Tax=Gonium pectorale TaxID=33097 RepID=A0A150G217_GONPE|nr:hypothetical protein GPECTOR_79g130 [Gonium pectorale]|eukprot:KXZ43851.1 hypothetical protein GPECTOR_79g130 [Gonium pectorale]
MVPVLWGTYNPTIRYLYAEENPLDPASLTAVRTTVSAVALLLLPLASTLYQGARDAWKRRRHQQQQQQDSPDGSVAAADAASRTEGLPAAGSGAAGAIDVHHAPLTTVLAVTSDGSAADGVAVAAVAGSEEAAEAAAVAAAAAARAPAAQRPLLEEPLKTSRLGPVLTRTFSTVILGGLELGLLNFLGTALQVEGLHSTSATRAGFLAEVTAILTPFVSYLAGYEIPRQMWLAVAVGLVGSTMVAYDTSLGSSPPSASASKPETSTDTAVAAASTAADSAAASSGAGGSSALVTETSAAALAPLFTTERAADLAAGPAPSDTQFVTTNAADIAAGAVQELAASDISIIPAVDAACTAGQVTTEALAVAASLPAVDIVDSAASTVLAVSGAASAAAEAAVGAAADAANAVAEATGGAVADAVAAAAVASVAAATATAAAAPVSEPLAITGGEAYLLMACLFFSICTVRMGIYAPRMDTAELAAMKKVGLSSMSLLWMASSNLQHGADLGSVFAFPDLSTRSTLSVAVLLYSGLGPGALATYLQFAGLSTVPATTAQVIYSMTPLCTAFFAFLILGGEATGPLAWVGGSLIIVAAIVAADAQQRQQKEMAQQRQTEQGAVQRADCP